MGQPHQSPHDQSYPIIQIMFPKSSTLTHPNPQKPLIPHPANLAIPATPPSHTHPWYPASTALHPPPLLPMSLQMPGSNKTTFSKVRFAGIPHPTAKQANPLMSPEDSGLETHRTPPHRFCPCHHICPQNRSSSFLHPVTCGHNPRPNPSSAESNLPTTPHTICPLLSADPPRIH